VVCWSPLFSFYFWHFGWSALWLSQTVLVFKLAHNGLAIGEEADLEALYSLPPQNLIRSTKHHLSTKPAFLPNAC